MSPPASPDAVFPLPLLPACPGRLTSKNRTFGLWLPVESRRGIRGSEGAGQRRGGGLHLVSHGVVWMANLLLLGEGPLLAALRFSRCWAHLTAPARPGPGGYGARPGGRPHPPRELRASPGSLRLSAPAASPWLPGSWPMRVLF